MNLKVIRTRDGYSTLGQLLVDGVHECYTVEPPIREIKGEPVEMWKVKGDTAVPAGRFPVIIAHSERWKREIPHVMDIPGFDAVEIHVGNNVKDTEACLCVGTELMVNGGGVLHSQLAFDRLFPKIQAALNDGGEVWIEYVNPQTHEAKP